MLFLFAAAHASPTATYQVFVRSFADSDGDGVGDLSGLIEKLDYIEELGVDALWLMPIFPSPSYHGYDVMDYRAIAPEYGSMEDFQTLIANAHGRGMSVIIDLPVNHTSIEHPWFTERPGYYVWAGESANLNLSVMGEKVWKQHGDNWYYAFFWSGMPDFNYENPEVRAEIIDIALFWLEMGVDGFRLDAASHIYAMGEVSAKQEINRSAQWWVEFREALKAEYPDCYLLGEVWESLDKRSELLAGLDSAVNFDAGEMITALLKSGGSGRSYVRSLQAVYDAYARTRPDIPDAPFLTNHDQNRIFSMLGAKPERAKMAANMLATLPGNAILYYGEEIGMMGAKPDEEIRTPMLWGSDDPLQTDWMLSRYNLKTVGVFEQSADPNSLLNHYRRIFSFRKAHYSLSRGALAAADVNNSIVAAYSLTTPGENALIIHNFTAAEQETSEGILRPYSTYIKINDIKWSFP
jgi:glycosidase